MISNFFIAFVDNKARDSFLERLVTLNPRLSSNQELSEKKLSLLTKQWQEGQIESFDYLMQINQLGMYGFQYVVNNNHLCPSHFK